MDTKLNAEMDEKDVTDDFFGPSQPEISKFCAQCLDDISRLLQSFAFCKQCGEFLCSESCLRQHAKNRLTRSHTYHLGTDLIDYIRQRYKVDVEIDEVKDITDGVFARFQMKHAVLRSEFNIRARTDTQICSIHAAVVLPSGRLVLADLKNNNLKLYDVETKECLSVMALNAGPRDMCLSNVKDNEIYVAEAEVKGLHQVRIENNSLQLVDTLSTEGECHGVTCWKRGIAATLSNLPTAPGQYELRLHDYKGNFRRKFVANKIRDLEFELPWYLHSDVTGQFVYISDYGNNRVTCVDVDHGVLSVYADDELLRPVSIATDNNGDLFIVSQRSHTIHHVSASYEKKGVIYDKKGMEYPGSICYDKNNDSFYVQCTGWSDKMQLFKFDQCQEVQEEET